MAEGKFSLFASAGKSVLNGIKNIFTKPKSTATKAVGILAVSGLAMATAGVGLAAVGVVAGAYASTKIARDVVNDYAEHNPTGMVARVTQNLSNAYKPIKTIIDKVMDIGAGMLNIVGKLLSPIARLVGYKAQTNQAEQQQAQETPKSQSQSHEKAAVANKINKSNTQEKPKTDAQIKSDIFRDVPQEQRNFNQKQQEEKQKLKKYLQENAFKNKSDYYEEAKNKKIPAQLIKQNTGWKR